VFVANPNKTQPILDILLKNQTKLIEFLSKFQNDRTEDEQFNDEKTYLVKQIRDLKRPAQQEALFSVNTYDIPSNFSICC
ncbi:Calcium-binding 39, partial [Sigmodon hispidus]